MKNKDNLIIKITIVSIILASNIASVIFLCSSAELLLKNLPHIIYIFIYGFFLYAFLIDSVLLYLYITSTGILMIDEENNKRLSVYTNIAKTINNFTYRYGVEFAFYIFTFSVVALLGGYFVVRFY